MALGFWAIPPWVRQEGNRDHSVALSFARLSFYQRRNRSRKDAIEADAAVTVATAWTALSVGTASRVRATGIDRPGSQVPRRRHALRRGIRCSFPDSLISSPAVTVADYISRAESQSRQGPPRKESQEKVAEGNLPRQKVRGMGRPGVAATRGFQAKSALLLLGGAKPEQAQRGRREPSPSRQRLQPPPGESGVASRPVLLPLPGRGEQQDGQRPCREWGAQCCRRRGGGGCHGQRGVLSALRVPPAEPSSPQNDPYFSPACNILRETK